MVRFYDILFYSYLAVNKNIAEHVYPTFKDKKKKEDLHFELLSKHIINGMWESKELLLEM